MRAPPGLNTGLPSIRSKPPNSAFAADGLALGVKRSFLKHMADDAIIFTPDPTSAPRLLRGPGG
ncbi:hypothetical protein ACRAWD_17165 [Caulobacter segnis]